MKIVIFLYSYLATLHRDTKGASAIEYAVIAGIIAVGLILVLTTLGEGIGTTFGNITDAITGGGED